MSHTAEPGRVAQQELAAPSRAVRAITGAIPRDAQRRPVRRILRQTGGQVGVVVLDRDQGTGCTYQRTLVGRIFSASFVR